jgi:flavin reductase (DIM6/NTAB) family NADH-FMN oxidoreductase RutF
MNKLFINADGIEAFEKQQRINLINSIGGFKSVVLVGTKNKHAENLAIFSSLVHIGAHPPLVGLIFRPSPPERDTYQNILDTGFYTINHINSSFFKQAHQTSARYDAGISEFTEVGLTPEYKEAFQAPFVKESTIQLGVEFRDKLEIHLNNTTMIIGEITQIHIPKIFLNEDGFVDLTASDCITCSGLDSYHSTQQLDRLSYAKPNLPVTSILKND